MCASRCCLSEGGGRVSALVQDRLVLTTYPQQRALGGEVTGGQVKCPGPGHSPADRSLSVKPADNEDGFVVDSHAGDMWEPCKDHVRQRLGGERSVSYQPPRNLKPCKPMQDEEIAARYAYHDENGELLFEEYARRRRSFYSAPRMDGD